MIDSFDLTGRRALITGASRGIGLAIAEGLAQRGAAVAITGRKPESLEQAASQLRGKGAQATMMVCHQGEPQSVVAMFERLDGQGFTPDIVFINAATNPILGSLIKADLSAWQKIVDVNVTGALVTAQQAAQRMIPFGKGSMILVTSVAGLDPMPGIGAYSISKSALIGMAKTLAKELGPTGVRVNALAPGLVETRFSAALFQDRPSYDRLMAATPLGRHAQPSDIVGAAIFLASDASAYITGQVLVVDGGARV